MILAAKNGEKGEFLEKQGYGESTMLSSEWERCPNYPPPSGAAPILTIKSAWVWPISKVSYSNTYC